MQPLIGNDLLASAVFSVVLGGWILFEMGLSARRRPERGTRRRDRGSGLLVFASVFAAFVIMGSAAGKAPGATISTGPWLVFALGIAVAIAGFALRVWAILILGRSFVAAIAVSPGQKVVDRGPYRLIRHPSYAGGLVTVLGAALAFDNWLSLVAVVPLLLAYVYRINVEEATLQRELGGPYEEYRLRTKRLIPFVY